MNKLVSLNVLQSLQRSSVSTRHASSRLFARTTISSPTDKPYQPLLAPTCPSAKFFHTTSLLKTTATGDAQAAESTKRPEEKSVGPKEKFDFQAETKQLLNIVAKSLYSENEVFIRELVSNASDALEKLKYKQMTTGADDHSIPYEISLECNDITNTLTIQDTGLGMTKEELIKNLGTIAHSGSKAFIESLTKASEKDAKPQSNNVIGQFGVGFYSAFMVADKVQVFTQSWEPGAKAYEWNSTGDGSYELNEAEGVQRGTKIIVFFV